LPGHGRPRKTNKKTGVEDIKEKWEQAIHNKEKAQGNKETVAQREKEWGYVLAGHTTGEAGWR